MKNILTKCKNGLTNKYFQFVIVGLGLLVTVMSFIFALGFSTNWALSRAEVKEFSEPAQKVNHVLYMLSLFSIIFSVLIIGFRGHRRKRYYLTNLILGIVSGVFNIVLSIYTIIKMGILKELYIKMGDAWYLTHLQNGETYSTSVFSVGLVVAIITIVISILLITMTVVKFVTQPKRKVLPPELASRVR